MLYSAFAKTPPFDTTDNACSSGKYTHLAPAEDTSPCGRGTLAPPSPLGLRCVPPRLTALHRSPRGPVERARRRTGIISACEVEALRQGLHSFDPQAQNAKEEYLMNSMYVRCASRLQCFLGRARSRTGDIMSAYGKVCVLPNSNYAFGFGVPGRTMPFSRSELLSNSSFFPSGTTLSPVRKTWMYTVGRTFYFFFCYIFYLSFIFSSYPRKKARCAKTKDYKRDKK